MFILSILENFVTMAKILTPISTDFSVLFSLAKAKGFFRGKGFLQFTSLTKLEIYIFEIKKLICNFSTQNKSFFNKNKSS